MEHFFNRGYGWMCRFCSAKDEERESSTDSRSSFFREGEAEEKEPNLASAHTLAKWADDTRRTLLCPRCGAREEIAAQ